MLSGITGPGKAEKPDADVPEEKTVKHESEVRYCLQCERHVHGNGMTSCPVCFGPLEEENNA